MPLIDGPDCGIWVKTIGSGDPVTVFAHGVTGSLDELAPLAARTPGTRVLFDFRGHGRSDQPPDIVYDHPAMRRDLEFVADHAGATRAFGVSMGAGALMNLLADSPARFARVAFFLPASIDGPNPAAEAIFPAMGALLERHTLDEVVERSMNAPAQQPLFARRPYWRDLMRARILRMNGDGVPRALRAYVTGRAPVTDAALLTHVHAPALILAHEGDPVHDAAVARRLASLLPDARLQVWDEPLAMYDDIDALATWIGEFLGS